MILFELINDPQKSDDYWNLVYSEPVWAHWHLRNNPMKSVTPEQRSKCEAAIATDAWTSFFYAKDTIEARFEMGEPAIASIPLLCYNYSWRVAGERFLLGEETLKNLTSWDGNKSSPRRDYNKHWGTDL